MDEEIEEERKRTYIDKHTAGFIRGRMETCSLDMPRRLKHELTTRLGIKERMKDSKDGATFGTAPFLREKPTTTAIIPGTSLTLTAVVTGAPEPTVQWSKGNIVLTSDSHRIAITTSEGKSTLTISDSHEFDAGLYKVVARNDLGHVAHKFRLVPGRAPGPCHTPEVKQMGDTEALVSWKSPLDDGESRVLCYKLQIKHPGETEWATLADNIDHEFYKVTMLRPECVYLFRVVAKNAMGWGDTSPSTGPVRTHALGAPTIHLTPGMTYLQKQTQSGKEVPLWTEKSDIDYTKEQEPVKMKTGDNAQLQVRKYNPVAEVTRGRFGTLAKCVRSDDHRRFVLKIMHYKDCETRVNEEFEMHKSLRHERIVQLYEAYCVGNFAAFVLEPLGGVDILTYLAAQYQYSEQQVYTVTSQVLDALSYLHWRGFCHLDLQPDNVVVVSTRRCDVKLVDFGSTQKVAKTGSPVTVTGLLDYIAPEVLLEHKAHPSSDIWSLGCVVYALLSGCSAFGGENEEETKENIQYVRYDPGHLNPGLSAEAIRFLMLIFKRDPCKRPSEDECWDHKWLVESDYMCKKRERVVFFGARLREYDKSYHEARLKGATTNSILLNFNDAAFPPTITYDADHLSMV